MADDCCSCCCCSEQDEEKKTLYNNKNQPVTMQSKSAQKYVTGTNESHVMQEVEARNDNQILEREVADLQARLDDQTKRHKEEVYEYEAEINELKLEVGNLEIINNELLSRFNAIASAKLTDNNPNTADLSDENRPTKLSEQFSELYDNEWTDAIEALTGTESNVENEKYVCNKLLTIVITIYSTCHEKASKDLQQMEKMASTFSGMETPSRELLKALKDERKKHYSGTLHQARKDCDLSLQDVISKEEASVIAKFIDKCASVCWLMAIQDQPVFIDAEIDLHGEPLSTNIYKPYAQSGKTIDYLVWPVLYLYQGGTVLSKGVAQGMNEDKEETTDQVTHF